MKDLRIDKKNLSTLPPQIDLVTETEPDLLSACVKMRIYLKDRINGCVYDTLETTLEVNVSSPDDNSLVRRAQFIIDGYLFTLVDEGVV